MTPTPTASITPTPTVTQIICGSGLTTGNFYYTDCCGYLVTGTTIGLVVSMDYTKPFNGVTKLNTTASQICPTPTQTPTISPTNTTTPSQTPTLTQTKTPTPTPTPTRFPGTSQAYSQQNECDVFTLFDMGIQCETISSPTSSTSTNGALNVIVTGGTAPYSFYWGGGQRIQSISGLPPGDYPITVVDYYGDYTASTVCSLFGPTPSQTPTQTMTPTPSPTGSYPDLCLTIIYPTITYGPFQFTYNTIQNDRPSWVSGSYSLIWSTGNSRWEIQGWNLSSGIPVSTAVSSVPLGSWTMAGASGDQPIISMIQGTCPSNSPLITSVSVTNTTCNNNNNCNGSIVVTTQGGQPPYSYSINNGITYQSSNVFNGLCSNTYTVLIKDSNNDTQTQIVNVGSDSSFSSYTVNMVVTEIQPIGEFATMTYWKVNVSPALPIGVSINLTLDINTTQTLNRPGTGSFIYYTVVKQGNTTVTAPLPEMTFNTEGRPGCNPYTRDVTTLAETYGNLTITNSNGVSGYSYSDLSLTPGESDQVSGCVTVLTQNILLSTSNTVINGCICCNVINDPTPVQGGNEVQYGGPGQYLA